MNCDCRGKHVSASQKKAGDDCAKWGYAYPWCYTVDNKCGANGKNNWKDCVIPPVDSAPEPNCNCKNDGKPGSSCGKWG